MEQDIVSSSYLRIERLDFVKRIKTIRWMRPSPQKLYDFPDVDSYYRNHSCISTMPDVAVPMLCLNADDPLMDPPWLHGGKDQFADYNPNIDLATRMGGASGVGDGMRQWMSSAVGLLTCAALS
jgi:predicted alpha/beta-fold hydrolase